MIYGLILWLMVVLGSIFLIGLVFLSTCFYFYVKALEEAHRDGWDMPS